MKAMPKPDGGYKPPSGRVSVRDGDADDAVKTTGSYKGKSNKLGHGGRAAQLKAKGVPGGVIGNLARKAGAAPGGPNYHPSGKGKASGKT